MNHVIVINQFALPRTEAGGTRHIDLFSRVNGWCPLIIAGNRNHYSQETFTTNEPDFKLISVPKSTGGAISRAAGWIVYSIKAFALAMLQKRVDVVYGSTPQILAPLAAMAAARLRRVPFVLEVRDLWPESIVSAGQIREGGVAYRTLAALERLLATRADAVVVVTEGWEEHFDRLGVRGNRLVVVPNGTEVAEFRVEASRDQLRMELGIDGFTAVFAGAHGPKDGIDLILDAARECPSVNFLLIGEGSEKQRSMDRARFQRLDNVEFREPISKAKLGRLLRACDVGVHTVSPLSVFQKGMSPNKLFDYMAAGLPVVSNAAEAISRILTNGECGPLGGPGDLAECLKQVEKADKEQRARWGNRAQIIVSERYSRQAAATILRGVLETAGQGRR